MIVIPRGLCRALPALARKCVVGRPRGPAPPVAFESEGGTLTAWVRTGEAVLLHSTSCPTGAADGHAVVPMAALEAAAGPGDGPVELLVGPGLKGEARWADRGVPRAHPFDAILPGEQHRPPDMPDAWHPPPPRLLTALHECGRTAAKGGGRYALDRVQVRGKTGQVVASDGRTALVWGGLAFPFAEDVLVPALPAFGSKELAGAGDVRVGLSAAHLAIAAGPWRVLLPIDREARYPDVAAVVPRGAAATADIDERDAADLLAKLPGLPGGDAEDKPVTLALGGGVSVWAKDDAGATERVRLGRSSSEGPPAQAVLDRRVLARALALGCLTARVAAGGKPAAFEGGGRTLVAMPLDPALAAADASADMPFASAAHAAHATPFTPATTERRAAVAQDTNGHAPHGRTDAPPADAPDPLAAAEELRAALADAAAKAGLLVAALKHRNKEKRALTQVWSSLKALNLGGEGRP